MMTPEGQLQNATSISTTIYERQATTVGEVEKRASVQPEGVLSCVVGS